ncbi:unnamed protein product [Strongylus vulgaris]|uniref:Uncharacterized protein n=1 Tax=Strongylus vulgaris TaxID=40348 RepID=A0A3P7IHX7_STRVU|nr:unnamed protein product [Strongylus vulgaris]
MVDALLRTLRYRFRRSSSLATKYLNDTNTVNLAIEDELAVLNDLDKKDKRKKTHSWPNGSITKKEAKQGARTAKQAETLINVTAVCLPNEKIDKGRF